MTATQAPTPGLLSTEHEFNPDLSMAGEGYCMVCGRHQDDHAPTAPVEASGSEREWMEAAEAVCAEVVKRAEATCRKATDELYEGLLYSVQDYLRENVTLNLQGELDRAHGYERDARAALVEIAKAAGVAFVDGRDGVGTQKDRILAALRPQPSGETR